MARMISVTADVQHGKVTFRYDGAPEVVYTVKSFVEGAKIKANKKDILRAASDREASERAIVSGISDKAKRDAALLSIGTEENKARRIRQATSECESVSRISTGKKKHAEYMHLVERLCEAMREGAA